MLPVLDDAIMRDGTLVHAFEELSGLNQQIPRSQIPSQVKSGHHRLDNGNLPHKRIVTNCVKAGLREVYAKVGQLRVEQRLFD